MVPMIVHKKRIPRPTVLLRRIATNRFRTPMMPNPPVPPASTPSSSPCPRDNKWKGGGGGGGGRWKWGSKRQWQPLIQVQEIGSILLQLGIVIFAMRLLRPGIPLPGSEPRIQTSIISVPFSDFLSKINNNQVQKVEVDRVRIIFRLKSDTEAVTDTSAVPARPQEADALLLKTVTPTKRIVYTATRPTDIKMPYEKMLENQVEFGSPDRRSVSASIQLSRRDQEKS